MTKNQEKVSLWTNSTLKLIDWIKSYKASCFLSVIILLMFIILIFQSTAYVKSISKEESLMRAKLGQIKESCFTKDKEEICLRLLSAQSQSLDMAPTNTTKYAKCWQIALEAYNFNFYSSVLELQDKRLALRHSSEILNNFYPDINTSLQSITDLKKLYIDCVEQI